MIDPTVELLQAMAECGLHPKDIHWDSRFHRFPGIDQTGSRGDNGWVKAFADQRGAIFGDNRTKEQWKWPGDHPEWKEKMQHAERLSAEEVERRRKEKRKERAEAAKKATAKIEDTWNRAKPCPNHPYLEGKGIRNVKVLRSLIDPQTRETMLLIPMRNARKELRNIQRIWPDGTRKQMWQPAGSVGLYDTIGAKRFQEAKTLYVCEGWATGWSVHLATDCAVIVAFFDGGLRVVGKAIQKKFPEAEIIIAADNDRWKFVKRDGEMVNPGVYAARTAAEELGVKYCVPDFADLETKPTDYDDLRRLEGLNSVRKWLDPKMAAKAVTEGPREPEPEPEGDTETEEEKPLEEERELHWTEAFPCRCLGGIEDNLFFLPDGYGHVISFPARQLTPLNLGLLAPQEWYEEYFGRETRTGNINVDYRSAGMGIIHKSTRIGTYQSGRLRGRGAWEDEGQPLFHFGDRLLPPRGGYVQPETYGDGIKIYPQLGRLDGPTKKVLPLRTSRWVLRLFEDLLWESPASGALAAGWLALAPLCGFLRWRPHIWITGPAGCGKTTILYDIMRPLLGGMGFYTQGITTTEPGIRQRLKLDALPLLIDEAGRDDPVAQKRIGAIIRLMRASASAGAESFKGTQDGKGMSFQMRSMFCLGSVGGALRDAQDQQRITVLQLRHPTTLGDKPAQDKVWLPVERKIRRVTPHIGRMLIARSIQWARTGKLDELLAVTKTAATIVMNNRRHGDQLGTLMAGAFLLQNDDIPPEDEVVSYMKDLDIREYVDETEPEGRDILNLLCQAIETVPTPTGTHKVSVGEMLSIVITNRFEQPKDEIHRRDAVRILRNIGFVVDHDYLFISNNSVWIRKALSGTSYAEGYAPLLRQLPEASASGPRHFGGRKDRTTKIPVHLISLDQGSSQQTLQT